MLFVQYFGEHFRHPFRRNSGVKMAQRLLHYPVSYSIWSWKLNRLKSRFPPNLMDRMIVRASDEVKQIIPASNTLNVKDCLYPALGINGLPLISESSLQQKLWSCAVIYALQNVCISKRQNQRDFHFHSQDYQTIQLSFL